MALLLAFLPLAAQSRPLQVGFDRNYPPYEYLDAQGRPAGFNIDLIRALAKESGLSIELRGGTWTDVRGAFERGELDVLTGMFATEERSKRHLFSVPHSIVAYAIFTRRGAGGPDSEAGFPGKRILVEQGDLSWDYLRSKGYRVEGYPNPEDALRALAAGTGDCAVLARATGLYHIHKEGWRNLERRGEPFLPQKYCLAVAKERADLLSVLNEGLFVLKTSGKLAEISDRHFLAIESRDLPFRVVLRRALFILLPVLGLLLAVSIWTWVLRRIVAQRTRALSHELEARARMEEALRESERKARAIFDRAFGLVGLLTPDGTLLDLNRTAIDFVGAKPSDVMGRPFWEGPWWAHSEEAREQLRAAIAKAACGELVRYETTHWSADGTLHTLDFSLKPVLGEGGQVSWLIPEGRDITERKVAEQALKEREEQYRSLFEYMFSGFVLVEVILDPDGNPVGHRLLQANSEFERMTGLDREAELGRTSAELSFQWPPEVVESYYRVALGGEPLSFERFNESLQRHYEIRVYSPQKGQFALIFHDISERKKVEAQILAERDFNALLINSTPVFYVAIDGQGRVVSMNTTLLKTLGYTLGEVTGADYLQTFVPEPERPDLGAVFARIIQAGEATVTENHIRARDGRILLCEWHGTPIFRGDRLDYFIGMGIDITERKRTEEALRQSESRYRTFFEQGPDGVVILNPENGKIVEFNDQACRQLGYTRQEFGRLCLADFEESESPEDVQRHIQSIVARGRDDFESRHRSKQGEIRNIRVTAQVVEAGESSIYLCIWRDITEHKQAEKALLLKNFVFTSSVAANSIANLAGLITEVNDSFLRLWGFASQDEALDLPISAFFLDPAESLPVMEALRNAGTWEGFFTARRRDGTTFLAQGFATDLKDEKGDRIGYQSSVLDVTERKLAEEAVLESERRLRSLFEGSPIGMFRSTPEGKFLQVNSALAAMFRYETPFAMVEEVNRLGISATIYEFPERRSDLVESLWKNQGTWLVEEVHFRRKDGTFMDGIMSSILNPDPASGHFALFGFVQDISERKRSELEIENLKTYLANIIDSMPSVLVGLDQEGTITQWNHQARVTTGLSATEAVGRSVEDVLSDFSPWIQSMREEVLRLREPVAMEKILLEKDGERNFYDLMLYPLVANCLQGSVVRIEDVTERARIQELMIQTEKMMSVGGLAAGMAHEINNPLGIISQAAQNIERRLSPELAVNQAVAEGIGLDLLLLRAYFQQRKIPEFVASIQEAVGRATKIVGNMLQFSRKADAGKVPASLAAVVQQAVELAGNDYDLKKKFDFRSIEILRDFEPELPLVSMVAIEVEQVVLNLLKNSAQAMIDNPPERRPRLEIRIWKEAPHLVLEIADNGPGMDESVRRRIFEPFFTTKEPGVGTGLGLSVSYMIITQNHKGLLEVDSAPGQGACFRVRLPMDSGNSHA